MSYVFVKMHHDMVKLASFHFSEEKSSYLASHVLQLLIVQVDHLKSTLKALDQNYATQDEKDTCMGLVRK